MLVVVDNFDLFGMGVPPHKAKAELVVDANAPLADPVPGEGLEAVAWRRSQIVKPPGDIELSELSQRRALNSCEAWHSAPEKEGLCVRALE